MNTDRRRWWLGRIRSLGIRGQVGSEGTSLSRMVSSSGTRWDAKNLSRSTSSRALPLPSGSIDNFSGRENRLATKWVAQAGALNQIDLATEEILQVLAQLDQFEQAGMGFRAERYQHVHVAVGSEVVAQDRTEQRQLGHTVAPA